MIGSVTSGPWLARNYVVLKSDRLSISEDAGLPLNRSGITVRYPACAKLSAKLAAKLV